MAWGFGVVHVCVLATVLGSVARLDLFSPFAIVWLHHMTFGFQ